MGGQGFAAPHLTHVAQGTLLLLIHLRQLSRALEKPKENIRLKNLFDYVEREHRPMNLVQNTNLPNLLLGTGARAVFSLLIKTLSFMDPREVKAAKHLLSNMFNACTVGLESLLTGPIAAASSSRYSHML